MNVLSISLMEECANRVINVKIVFHHAIVGNFIHHVLIVMDRVNLPSV